MKHISLRLAWHDEGWNGHICKNPRANTHCVGQHSYLGDLISHSRDLEWEEQENVAGCHCSTIDAIHFEVFRPMFEFIMTTIANN
ncbi:hypothetical protein LXD69_16960 [Flavobacterium sediminilitoris]|uniref:Uncharacterized protein n=1 Tax=Flavobacterium sediminilitoris TaxID=2024526 RepID=A0ABY4HM22_9FLAO|nr:MULTISPECIES: hypothetical protein [Flavobacterium]UOX33711.1 hypothetical protein LXD69_16960 [Flavobacterium sediminilitoris]